MSWSVLDHERHPKLAYRAVIEACRPVIVVADRLPDAVTAGDTLALDVHVVSDLRTHARRRARAPPRCAGRAASTSGRGRATCRPTTCVRVGTAQFVVPDTAGELWLDLVLEHGDAVATNRYTTSITHARRLKFRVQPACTQDVIGAGQIWLISLRFLNLALR